MECSSRSSIYALRPTKLIVQNTAAFGCTRAVVASSSIGGQVCAVLCQEKMRVEASAGQDKVRVEARAVQA